MKIEININLDESAIKFLNSLMSPQHSLPIKKEAKAESVKKNESSRMRLTTQKKKCIACGKLFTPRGNAQKRCSPECGMKTKKRYTQKEIKETIAEIERNRAEREKVPYEFNK